MFLSSSGAGRGGVRPSPSIARLTQTGARCAQGVHIKSSPPLPPFPGSLPHPFLCTCCSRPLCTHDPTGILHMDLRYTAGFEAAPLPLPRAPPGPRSRCEHACKGPLSSRSGPEAAVAPSRVGARIKMMSEGANVCVVISFHAPFRHSEGITGYLTLPPHSA